MNKMLWSGLATSVMLGALAAPLPATARPDTQIAVRVAPPPMRMEARPAPRRGYEWVPGYWDWRGNRHVWVPGTWVKARAGYHYAQPQWVSHNGRWILVRGHWARGDRDRDGVPNRYDRDRDGDGVPNRYDSRPDDPRRQ